MYDLTFAEYLRKAAGLSYSSLARRVDNDRQTVWRWLTGKVRATDEDCAKKIMRELIFKPVVKRDEARQHVADQIAEWQQDLTDKVNELGDLQNPSEEPDDEQSPHGVEPFLQVFKDMERLIEMKDDIRSVHVTAATLELATEAFSDALEKRIEEGDPDSEMVREDEENLVLLQKKLEEFGNVRESTGKILEKIQQVRLMETEKV